MSKSQTDRHIVEQFIAEERLPASFADMAFDFFLPLSDYLMQCLQHRGQTLVVGINGAQGTGKSTLSELIRRLFGARQRSCVVISLDDLYLTREQRARLAQEIHPLLITRGVPGTHDLELGLQLMSALRAATDQSRIAIPRFDKALDDRCPQQAWTVHSGGVDVIVLEGWCVGAQPAVLTGSPINTLEQQQDADGHWRRFIGQQLVAYQQLFKQMDTLIMLKAPSMDSIIEWRLLQEHKLSARVATAQPHSLMSESQLRWFIMHYERLTRIMLETMPAQANVVFNLDGNHLITGARYREQGDRHDV
jgi:D-glycerate 3-kinase